MGSAWNDPRDGAGLGRRMCVAVVAAAALLTACAPAGLSNGSPPDKATLDYVKRTVNYQEARAQADLVAAGAGQSVLEFTVEDTPPSIFVNWVVPDAQAAAFTSAVGLPPGFTLAKVKIIESDLAPKYWLSLNVYRVSGLTTGLRAEWSTYVDDGSGVPRFMIIRARAAEGSLDPIGPLALAEPFTHSLGSGVISTAMNTTVLQNGVPILTADNLFNSTIALPDPVDRHYVVPTREWVTANDFIYWLNGVNDRIFHNSTSHSAPLISVDLADVVLNDDSEWATFVDPVPGHVLVYLDKIQFMIGPWWNVTEPDGRVAPGTRGSLLDLKKSIYSGLAGVSALSILSGTSEPIVQSSVDSAPSAVSWHWRIPSGDLAAFQTAARLPPGLALTTVKLEDSDLAADHWLTLNVSQKAGASGGLRAEWTTYVSDGAGTRTFILEAHAGYSALDPVNLYTAPYPITHTNTSGSVSTTVGSGPAAFTSSFVVPPPGPGTSALASRQLIGAGDLRYWQNGVADRVFYDSTVFDPKTSVDPGTVTVTNGGPWAAFVGSGPEQVWVDRAGVDLVTNPWWNLNGL